ncbi:PA2169 family four-helix-bundle protein [Epilithonimonas sp.]|uniref:PA2169 family four-helix-bundle protein n=1 Tax=Epilithonimonas sp. TaxID=2894511 RepID=UPI00289A9AE6|nr:PA2169 family four-helix-bundle protein [Epilithonimonas sp.]
MLIKGIILVSFTSYQINIKMENQKTIEVLNDLLHISNDRLEGFEKVEGKIWEMNHDLQDDYEHMTSQTKVFKNELINLIIERGGKPDDSASVAGTIHRAWIDIKNSVLLSSLEASTLENVLFGENAAIQAYQEALDSGELDEASKEIVSEQLKKIKDSSHEFKGKLELRK